MRFCQIVAGVVGLCVWSLAGSLQAELIIEETFTGYPDNSSITVDPAGPATGLTGNWSLTPDNNFYVNKTQADDDAGTGKAVYDYTSTDNGTRAPTRSTSADHVLFENNGDVFYASFLIEPARADGDMTFGLGLTRVDGGGIQNLSFGIIEGQYIVGNGGSSVKVVDGVVTADEQLVVLRVEYGEADSGPDDSEVVTLWVDPIDESSTPEIDSVLTDILNRGGGKITAVSMRGDSMNGAPAFFDNLRVGSSFNAVVPLAGDYNADGAVEQADLDLVLLNWGTETPPIPEGWTGDPPAGLIEQNELDGVLLNWGNTSRSAGVVPEPTSVMLVLLGVAFASLRGCRVSDQVSRPR